VRPAPPAPERDLEFRDSPETIWDEMPRYDHQRYQRLVANPFLALCGLATWLLALEWVIQQDRFDRTWPIFLSLFGLPFLLQYHCLDCGATGSFLRWRQHACAAVRQRWTMHRPRRWRGPSPSIQLLLWFYGILMAGIIAGSLGWSIVPQIP
jgi:hypothetical protein